MQCIHADIDHKALKLQREKLIKNIMQELKLQAPKTK